MSKFSVTGAVLLTKSDRALKPKKRKKAFKALDKQATRARRHAEVPLAAADKNKAIKEALRGNGTLGIGDQVILRVKETEGGAEKLLRAKRNQKGKIVVDTIQPTSIQGKAFVAANGEFQKAQTAHTFAKTLRLDGKPGTLGRLQKALNDIKEKLGEGKPIKEALDKIKELVTRHVKGRKVKAKHFEKMNKLVEDLQKKPKDTEGAFKQLEDIQTKLKAWA